MKMKKQDFERLQAALSKTKAGTEVRARYRDRGLSAERYRWDAFHAACFVDPEIHGILYAYLADRHVDTALKRILTD